MDTVDKIFSIVGQFSELIDLNEAELKRVTGGGHSPWDYPVGASWDGLGAKYAWIGEHSWNDWYSFGHFTHDQMHLWNPVIARFERWSW